MVVRLGVAIVLAALLLGACRSGDDDGHVAVTTTTTRGTVASTTESSVAPLKAPANSRGDAGDALDALDDGPWFGRITAIDAVARTVTFDVAQLYAGHDADAAARADGDIPQDETVPDDYYIRNRSTRTRVVPVVEDVVVTVARCLPGTGCAQYAGDLAGLAASFGDPAPKTLEDRYRGAQSWYWLTVAGGRVVRIDEQYFP